VTHRPTLDYNTVVLADGGASAGLALAPHSVVLADGGAPACLALAPLSVVLADGGAPALVPELHVVADGGAPAAPSLRSMQCKSSSSGSSFFTEEHDALVPELHVVADGGAPAAPSLRSMQCKSSSAGSSFFTEEHDVMPQISCMSRKPTMYLAASITSLSLGTAPVLDGFSSRSEPAFNQTHRAGAFGGDQHVYTQSVCHCSWPLGRLAHAQTRAAQPEQQSRPIPDQAAESQAGPQAPRLVVLESSALIRPSVGFVY